MALQLRPLSIGEMLDRTFSMYRDHFQLFVGILVFPQLAIAFAAFGFDVVFQGFRPGSNPDPAQFLPFFAYLPIVIIVALATLAIAQAATVYAVSQVYLERPTTISASYSFIGRRFWSILGVIALIAIAGMVAGIVGLFALCVGAIVFPVLVTLYSAFAVPVTVLEGRDPVASLQRSYDLVKGDLGRIFVIWLLFVVLEIAASSLVSGPMFVVAFTMAKQWQGHVPVWFSAVGELGRIVVGCLVRPLLTIAFSVAYYDERVRKEALDMQFMMATIDRGEGLGATAAAGGPPSA